MISTHTPHVGCDGLPENWNTATDKNFNSHTPCGVRQVPCHSNLHYFLFQLTHPMWGATCPNSYTLSGRMRFQLTHPMWGATSLCPRLSESVAISTHTPHVGCDRRTQTTQNKRSDFNSHTPCGVRHTARNRRCRMDYFNSHTPCGVRPINYSTFDTWRKFQLTHPMWGATTYSGSDYPTIKFQLTHPMWGATCWSVGYQQYIRISTHTPHVGCDPRFCEKNKNRTLYVGVDIRNTAF